MDEMNLDALIKASDLTGVSLIHCAAGVVLWAKSRHGQMFAVREDTADAAITRMRMKLRANGVA